MPTTYDTSVWELVRTLYCFPPCYRVPYWKHHNTTYYLYGREGWVSVWGWVRRTSTTLQTFHSLAWCKFSWWWYVARLTAGCQRVVRQAHPSVCVVILLFHVVHYMYATMIFFITLCIVQWVHIIVIVVIYVPDVHYYSRFLLCFCDIYSWKQCNERTSEPLASYSGSSVNIISMCHYPMTPLLKFYQYYYDTNQKSGYAIHSRTWKNYIILCGEAFYKSQSLGVW